MTVSYTPVIVGVDGSPASTAALDWAITECRYRRLPLLLVHAVDWPLLSDTIAAQATVPVEVDDSPVLSAAGDRVRELAPDVQVDTRLVRGNPAAELIELSGQASLTVLGQRGRGGFAGLLLGSVSAQVTAHAHGPVLVMPAGAAEPTGFAGRVVVGMDTPEAAGEAMVFALDEAAARSAPVTVVHAWSVPPQAANVVDELENGYGLMLTDELAGWRAKYPDVPIRQRLVLDAPATALLSAVTAEDLLVVGSRGRGGFTGLLLGSTSRAVLHHAPCPVAVVRRTGGLPR